MSLEISIWLNKPLESRREEWLRERKNLKTAVRKNFIALRPDRTISSFIARKFFYLQPFVFGWIMFDSLFIGYLLFCWWFCKFLYLFVDSYFHMLLGLIDLALAKFFVFMIFPYKSKEERELWIQMTFEYQALEFNKLFRSTKLSYEPWICATPIISTMDVLEEKKS